MVGAMDADKAWIMPSLCRPSQWSRAREAIREDSGVVHRFIRGLDLCKMGGQGQGCVQ